MKFPAGIIKRIHVDKRVIAQNLKNGTNLPPITVQTSMGPHKAYEVQIRGPSVFKYSPTKPLSCGARLWVETRAEVVLDRPGEVG